MATMRNTITHTVKRDPLTVVQYVIIIETCSIVGIFLAALGVISNIINIKTFLAMGLGDGVTVSFLVLAIFDLTYLVSSLCLSVSTTFYVIELTSSIVFAIEPFAICIYLGTLMILINITNVLTTTFLAVARSCCVAMPLQFKNTFTRNRAIMFMSGFAVFAVGIYTPIIANMGIAYKIDKLTNRSRPSLWVSSSREIVKEVVWLVTELFLPVVTQFIILICIGIMSRSLRAASRFRHSSVASSKTVFTNGKSNLSNVQKSKAADADISSDKLTGKELRVVQQVVLISVVYIICNIPKILISVYATVEPEFAIGRSYTKMYLCVNGIRKPIEVVNAAINLLVYYKYNTKFRSVLCQSLE